MVRKQIFLWLNQNHIICDLSLFRSKPAEHVSPLQGTLSAVSTHSPVSVNWEILFLRISYERKFNHCSSSDSRAYFLYSYPFYPFLTKGPEWVVIFSTQFLSIAKKKIKINEIQRLCMQRTVLSTQLLAAVSHANSANRPKNKAIVVIVDHALPQWFYQVLSDCSQSHWVVWKRNIL